MPITELPTGFKGGTFSPKNNSDPSPPPNWIVIIVMVSEVEPVLKYNTKRNNPKQTQKKKRNSGVPAFLVAFFFFFWLLITHLCAKHEGCCSIFFPPLLVVAGMGFKGELSCTAGCQTHSFHMKQVCHSMLQKKKADQSTMNGHNISKPRTTCFHSSLSSPVAHFYIIFLNQKF